MSLSCTSGSSSSAMPGPTVASECIVVRIRKDSLRKPERRTDARSLRGAPRWTGERAHGRGRWLGLGVRSPFELLRKVIRDGPPPNPNCSGHDPRNRAQQPDGAERAADHELLEIRRNLQAQGEGDRRRARVSHARSTVHLQRR